MWRDILLEAWHALQRNRLRSLLTMAGISWGVVTVTLLLSYGESFRGILLSMFEAFGHDAVVVWPGTTSEQAGGERAGRRVRLEQADWDLLRARGTLIKHLSPETVHDCTLTYADRMIVGVVRGVWPEYGEMRSEVPTQGRWLNQDDLTYHRRVIFLGARLRERLFSGRPAVGESVRVNGVRFLVIGTMDRKFQIGNYFSSDDSSAWIPYTTAAELWDARYASVLVFEPIAGRFTDAAMQQVRDLLAERQHFSPHDRRALFMFGRPDWRPDAGSGRRGADEHHAGFGGGAGAGNRSAAGARGTAGSDSPAVSGRSAGADDGSGYDRHHTLGRARVCHRHATSARAGV